MEIRKRDISIIILSGKARSGKDSCYLALQDYYEGLGKKVKKLQFSYYIKEYAKELSDWDGSEESKPREFLQVLGTDIIRNNIDKDFFTKRTIEDIKVYSYFYDVIIISDARFISEINMVKEQFSGVKCINVVREESSELSLKEKMHETENGLDGFDSFDAVIYNDKSLDDLKETVVSIVKDWKC